MLDHAGQIKFPQNIVGFADVRPGKVGWKGEESEYLNCKLSKPWGSNKMPPIHWGNVFWCGLDDTECNNIDEK